jgi:hypothetical protein
MREYNDMAKSAKPTRAALAYYRNIAQKNTIDSQYFTYLCGHVLILAHQNQYIK